MCGTAWIRVAVLGSVILALASPSVQQVVGGHQGANPEDYTDDAHFAVVQLNRKNDVANKPLVLSEVMSVKTQVVAGTNVRMQLKVLDALNNILMYEVTVYHKLPQDVSNSPPKEMIQYKFVKTLGRAAGTTSL